MITMNDVILNVYWCLLVYIIGVYNHVILNWIYNHIILNLIYNHVILNGIISVCKCLPSQKLTNTSRFHQISVHYMSVFFIQSSDLLMYFIIYENNTHLNHIVHIHVTSFTHSYMNYPVYCNELLTNDTIFCLTNEWQLIGSVRTYW